MWPCLGKGTASLKFRQFKSAVCVAFGVIFVFGGPVRDVVCFVGCRGIRVTWFGLLGCLVDGLGLVVWLNVGLLVVNYFCVHVFCFRVRVQLRQLVVLLGVWSFDLDYL